MIELMCEIHNCDLECMGGCSAHPDNWFCPECDKKPEKNNKALEYIIPSDVEIKLDSSNNLLIDMSRDDDAGETLSIDLSESFYDLYRNESGEVNLQEMWAAVYNGIVDAIQYDLADIEEEQESLSPRFPERGRNL